MPAVVINTSQASGYASGLAAAACALRDGELVIFPTETVYGLAANAALPEAVGRLRALKGRSSQQAFTVHVGSRGQAHWYLTAPSPVFRRLARRAWPGPVTLLTEEPHPETTEVARRCSPEQLTEIYRGGLVGLRFPDHSVAMRLLNEAEIPVVASSANRQGVPPPLDLASALKGLAPDVAYALDAGRTRFSGASTIVEVRGNAWKIVRAGALDERAIARLARSDVLFVCTGNSCRSPMAECLWRHMLSERLAASTATPADAGYHVASAGTMGITGAPASSGALAEMGRRGLDLADHRSQGLTVELVHRAERVYVMSAEHREAVRMLVPAAAAKTALLDPAGSVADPIGGDAAAYQACADQLERAIRGRLEEFLNEDRDW